MVSQADIPPGGEGEIKVTLNTSHKRGKQQKTIEITSNDPASPITKVTITALIEVDFDFMSPVLQMGSLQSDMPVNQKALLLIKDPQNTRIVKLESSSPYVKARQGSVVQDKNGQYQIEVDVAVLPGLPPGRIDAAVTAYSNLTNKPKAVLRLSGLVQGYIDCLPHNIFFYRSPGAGVKAQQDRVVHVVNKAPENPFHIVSVKDPEGRLHVDTKTIMDGQQYEIMAALNEKLISKNGNYRGSILISTDHPKQKTVTVDYFIYSQE